MAYPPENGKDKGFTRNRWFMDEVSGMFHPESQMVRDWEGRLVFIDDVDAPGADELRDGWSPRTEQGYPDP